MDVADFFVELLLREGITHVFTVPGGTALPLMHALSKAPQVRTVVCKDERIQGLRGSAEPTLGSKASVSASDAALHETMPRASANGVQRARRRTLGHRRRSTEHRLHQSRKFVQGCFPHFVIRVQGWSPSRTRAAELGAITEAVSMPDDLLDGCATATA